MQPDDGSIGPDRQVVEMNILSVVGARSNFMKVAPLNHALAASGLLQSGIVQTGQHYDERMSDVFFKQLELPAPDVENTESTTRQYTLRCIGRGPGWVHARHGSGR